MRKSKKRAVFLSIAVLVGVTAILISITVMLCRRNVENRKKIAKCNEKRLRLERLENELRDRKAEMVNIENLMVRSAEILPEMSQARGDGFLQIYGSFTGNSGVRNISLAPVSSGEAEGGLRRHRYAAEVRGRFSEIVRFFNEIECHERFFRIDSFQLGCGRNVQQPDPDGLIRCRLTLSTYTFER
ncbi:MAG: hypothetical protein ACYS8W_15765 [Planctomycetota bacterium]|jgi:hypothetical protein